MQFSRQAKHDKQLYIVLIKATRVSTVFHLTSNSSAYGNDFHIFALVDSSLPEFIKNQHNDQLSVVSQRSWVQIPYKPDVFLLPIFTTAHVVFINATIAFIFIISSVDKTKLQSVTAVTATFQHHD